MKHRLDDESIAMEDEDAVPKRMRHLAETLVPLADEPATVPQQHGKRSHSCLDDDIDFSPLKRRRNLDPSQQNDLDPIYRRIVSWLNDQHARGSLPKTFSKLSRAITPMCRALVQVDCTVVFYHLIFNRIILLVENGDGSVTYCANPEPIRGSFVGFVPNDSPSVPFSDDFVRALERATSWVLSNRGLRYFKNPEGILSSLRQICKFKKEIGPDHMLEMLLRRGFICRGSGPDDIVYGLSNNIVLPPSPPTHYSPSYSEIPEAMA